MIDGTEKPNIPSKFAKRAVRYNKFGYNNMLVDLNSNQKEWCFINGVS